MSRKRVYIPEGQIEENFFDRMKQKNFIKPGRVRVFNLVQREVKDSDILLQEKDVDFYGIIDTDHWDDVCKQRFLNNVVKLEHLGKVYILVQDKNFEDELAYMVKPVNLFDYFKPKSRTNKGLKKHLMDEKYGDKKLGTKNYDDKFTKEHFDRYCARGEKVKKELLSYNKKIRFHMGKDLQFTNTST